MEKFINFAIEKAVENKQWDLYLTVYPNMTKDNFKTFEEYTGKKNKKEKSKIIDKKDNAKNEKDILADVALILKEKRL